MKSERRHELQENVLANWLGEYVEAMRPHAGAIVIGCGVLLASLVAYFALYGGFGGNSAAGWDKYLVNYADTNPAEEMKTLMDEEKGSAPGLWAKLAYANFQINDAPYKLVNDRKAAESSLEESRKAFEEIEQAARASELKVQAQYGLARVYENQNKLTQAREYYQKVADAEKDGPLGKAAAKAVKRLAEGGPAATMIAWLQEQKPAKPTGGGPNTDLLQGFGRTPQLPERPNLDVPGPNSNFPGGKTPGGKSLNMKLLDEDPEAEKFPGLLEKLKNAKPADAKPADAKPADAKKP